MKWLGALLIIAGSGAVGFSLASEQRKDLRYLRMLLRVLNYISCELQFRLPPLQELCLGASRECSGVLRSVLEELSQELERQVLPCVSDHMEQVLSGKAMPALTYQCLLQLGTSLGRFDLGGQLKGIEAVRITCKTFLQELEQNKDTRLRNYQTLSICAGAALAIILI